MPTIFGVTIPSEAGSRLVEVRREVLEALVAGAIDALDRADGDPDLEIDDPAEGDGTEGDVAAPDNVDQTLPAPMTSAEEDDEEDDPQGEVTEDEPAFDPLSRAIANRSAYGVAGCIVSDDDNDPYY